jgi:K+-sensing histidine kinase KdpD
MLDSLLLMSNIQSEKEYNIIEYDIWDIVEDICIEMRKKYHQKKIKLYYNKKHKLINVNLWLFVIIIRNLIDNSYKYTADKWTIIIKLNDSCITIEDTWIGISSNYLDNIWEPFWQEDKNNNDWVWLWLSLVQKIIEIFWWNIIIESKKWKWTTIFIYFTS